MAPGIISLQMVWRLAVVVQTLALIFFQFSAAQLPAPCPASCKDALVHFVSSPDSNTNLTLAGIAQNFNVALVDVAGANNYDLSNLDSLGDAILQPNATVRMPLSSCSCKGGNYTSDGITYTVQQGDYLYRIAQWLYGALLSWEDIARDNHIKNPDLILVDQVFNITVPCSCLRSNRSSPAAVALAYSVRDGDTSTTLAQQFNTSVLEISSLNPLMNTSNLTEGQVLQLSLPACSFNLSSKSLDNGLTVAYDAYAITAGSCVQCTCSRDLQSSCVPAPTTLPCSYTASNLTCPGTTLTIGSSMVDTLQQSNSSCQIQTCRYDGYTTSGILTRLEEKTVAGTCPAPAPPPPPFPISPPPGPGSPLQSAPPSSQPNSALGRNVKGASRQMLALAALLTLLLASA